MVVIVMISEHFHVDNVLPSLVRNVPAPAFLVVKSCCHRRCVFARRHRRVASAIRRAECRTGTGIRASLKFQVAGIGVCLSAWSAARATPPAIHYCRFSTAFADMLPVRHVDVDYYVCRTLAR